MLHASHTGADLPVNEGTPNDDELDGHVGWKERSLGNLVVVENGDYQIWLADLSSIEVIEGDIIEYWDEIDLSGYTGNSTRGHLHYENTCLRISGDFILWNLHS